MTSPTPRHVVFGDRVRQARLDHHFSQEQLGARLWPPASATTVSRWESGEAMPIGPVRHSLAHTLGFNYWDLFDPVETAEDLSTGQSELLMAAVHVRSQPHGWFVRAEGRDGHAHAEGLVRLNLAVSSGKEPGRPLWLYRVTDPGEEVREVLLRWRNELRRREPRT